MQNSDLKNVLIAAIENADNRLLSMLYAVTKSYQITENKSSTPVQESVDSPEPIATAESIVAAQPERKYKDDRPRRVVRIYRKPQTKAVNEVVEAKPVVITKVASEIARPVVENKIIVEPTAASIKESVVSGKSNNGGFITDLMTKTVSKNVLPA